LRSLTPNKRGAKSAESNPLSSKVRQLKVKVARLEKEIATAHTVLDVQGKVAGLLGFRLNDAKASGGPSSRSHRTSSASHRRAVR